MSASQAAPSEAIAAPASANAWSETAAPSSTGLDHGLEPQPLVAFYRVRRCRGTPLVVATLLGNADLHLRCLPPIWADDQFITFRFQPYACHPPTYVRLQPS